MTVMSAAPIDQDGQMQLPADARAALHVTPGSTVEVEVLADGVVLLRGPDPAQAWYWTQEWQSGEREADAELQAGRGSVYKSGAEFLASLEEDAG
jgi:AbrB family looped-hinge helix DNA binding protein